jgi:hypothetical protein
MDPRQDRHSHLFLVRFWQEGAQEVLKPQEGSDPMEWRGRVQHVLSGEARGFQDWPTLITMMLEMAALEAPDVIEVRIPDGRSTEVSP